MTETSELSEREKEILRLVATGASNKEIAQSLYISANTVKVHLRNIFSKIGATSRTEAAMYAVQAGLVAGNVQVRDDVEPGEVTQADVQPFIPVVEVIPEVPAPWWRRRLSLGVMAILVVLVVAAGGFWLNRELTPAVVNTPVATFQPRWQQRGSMAEPRKGMASVAYNNEIYLLGGETGSGVVGTVQKYNPALDEWQTLQSKPIPVTDVHGSVIGGKVYLPGGRLDDGKISTILEIYDLQENQWAVGAALPEPRSAYALAAFEGSLYLFGGWDGDTYRPEVYEYNPDQDLWSERSAMPTARAYAGAATIGDRIFIAGGENLSGPLNITEIYQPVMDSGLNNAWAPGVDLPEPRSKFGMAGIADIIYVIGGMGEGNNPLPSLEYFSEQAIWQAFELPFEKSWKDFGVAAVGSNLIGMGGELGDELVSDVWSYKAIYTLSIPFLQGSDQ